MSIKLSDVRLVTALVLWCASCTAIHAAQPGTAQAAPLPLVASAPIAPTPAIAGVVREGTPIVLVKEGLEAVEGPLRDHDGSLLFTNNQAGQILRAAADNSISTWFEGPHGANALTRLPSGEIVAALTRTIGIGVVQAGSAPPRLLAEQFEGKPFNRPNDLVADARGNIYFTDTAAAGAAAGTTLPSTVYRLAPDRTISRVTTDIARPNGVALSPDERTLYVANTAGDAVLAFALDADGAPGAMREFAKLSLPPTAPGAPAPTGAGTDGLAVDRDGRLFAATTIGVQVISPRGEPLGLIELPRQPQNLAFAGVDRSILYVVGRGAVFRIDTLTRGPDRLSK